ncbi:MAG: tetratricopeptide repeat protein [Candidatus Aminicenantes bacterium]|nr:tetratricopeptide repeat protein [Candidatus Aminicenantes bacterium]
MNKQSKLNIIIIILLLLFQGLSAQEGRGNGRVGGTVKDKMGTPIPGVKIVLKILTGVSGGARKMLGNTMSTAIEVDGKTTEKIAEGYRMEIISDKKGQWSLIGFASGQFLLTAEKEGYAPFEHNLAMTQMRRNPLIHIVLQKPEQEETPGKIEPPAETGLKIGNILYNEGKYEEALSYFQECMSKKPGEFEIGINLGNCFMALKKYDEAIKAFLDVIEGYKKEKPELKGFEKAATIYASIGEAYSILGNFQQATVYYRKSIEVMPPTDAAVAYNTAEILFNGGKTGEAIAYYSLASKLKPEMALYYSKLGYAYLNKGDIPAALANFETFVKLAPNDPQTPVINDLLKQLKERP